jgi:hypothetical protein
MFQRAVPQGRLKMSQDAILGYFYLRMDYSRFAAAAQDLRPGTFSVPYGTSRASLLTRTNILGYSQPSLRDSRRG